MLQRHRLHLLRYGLEVSPAMLAGNVAVGLQPLQILPDRRFRNAER